jgi:DNA-binding NarL/FixJ family response regulator
MIKTVIVDDDQEAAEALKRNIHMKDGIEVIDIYTDGRVAVECCSKKHPDIILMDVRMPVMDGIEASRLLKQKAPEIKILILTLFSEKESMIKAIENNCDGFLFKGHKAKEIISIIKNTINGLNTFERQVQAVFHEQNIFSSNKSISGADLRLLNLLTDREKEIIGLITEGKKDAEIASILFISEGYLRNKLVEIREKVGVHNSKELAAWWTRMEMKKFYQTES